jgi:hypothetical protein
VHPALGRLFSAEIWDVVERILRITMFLATIVAMVLAIVQAVGPA